MSDKLNRYQKVHKIAELARKLAKEDRNPIIDKKNNYIKEVNKPKTRRNYVLEAHDALATGKTISEAYQDIIREELEEMNDEEC